ncbi:L-ribulose-5-phosphate 4-epimerase AraD [Pontiella desulfatans]|uniref:L-ribulose-5-phosphate 4-epimerase n=1 Tax=Pontiella desulfatans TaxID=2750659 RepID=A0A6C2U073_PONDE|nr:L-ribulose-5-phosphate 4-epimerase [Pontiella desulfatans]VGO13350.1 L-ribulose-5-phosphate 4-epimerase AraD [Pontiella desulfatans]
MDYDALKERVCAANKEINRVQLAILTWGNASEVDREAGVFAIKPSGVDYDEMTPDDIPIISLETGEKLEGAMNPSSDTATHWHLYKAFPDIGGIVHTHSPYATAWAQAHRGIPCLGTTHADTFYGAVPCTRPLTQAEIEGEYELNTGKVIEEHFVNNGLKAVELPGVLVSSHAPFTWGADALKAVVNGRVLEEVAKMAATTFALNPNLGSVDQFLLDKHYLRKHGANAYYGQK